MLITPFPLPHVRQHPAGMHNAKALFSSVDKLPGILLQRWELAHTAAMHLPVRPFPFVGLAFGLLNASHHATMVLLVDEATDLVPAFKLNLDEPEQSTKTKDYGDCSRSHIATSYITCCNYSGHASGQSVCALHTRKH